MKNVWLIGIDDTDNEESIGTGRLARMLAAHLVEGRALEDAPSVTRHQLLVHPAVPYTSHNSSACIAGAGDPEAGQKIADLARDFMAVHEHEGANPGLCVCRADAVPERLPALGRRAQRVVIDLAAFDAEVAGFDLSLWSRGETGQGRIGAVSAVGLRSTGDDGRFIELRGIRQLRGRLSVREMLERSGVQEVRDEDGTALDPDAEIETGDWVRPSLCGGRAVHRVRQEGGRWAAAERRRREDDG